MKTFEKYLEEEVWEPEGVCDDDMPDAFEHWLSNLDIQEIIDSADEYGMKCYKQAEKDLEVAFKKNT